MNDYLKKMEYYESLKRKEKEQKEREQKEKEKEAQISRAFIPEDEDDKRISQQLQSIRDNYSIDHSHKQIESQNQKYQSIRKSIFQQINNEYKSEYDRSKYQKYQQYSKEKQEQSEAFTWEQMNPESVKQFISQRVQRSTFVKYFILGTLVYQFGKHLPYSFVYIQQFRDRRRYKKLLRMKLKQAQ